MNIFKGKSKRTRIFAIITFAVIVGLFGLNLLLSLVGQSNSVYIDMTPEGLYSVTDRMVEECSFVEELDEEKKLKIIFCDDPDNLADSVITRVTYFMAKKLDKIFDGLEVETVNVNFNPTAVSKYKATSLTSITPTDIIVAYGDRYRIVGAQNFWTTDEEGNYFSYNGEYKLATLMKSVTLANDKSPVAYFVTGHGETVYDESSPDSEGTVKSQQLRNLLVDRGLRVKVINLSALEGKEIPSDCALLIINNPTEDFTYDADRIDEFSYVSEIEIIDRYLTKNQGALMVAKDNEKKLENLEGFLSEWGFSFSDSTVKVPTGTPDSITGSQEMTDVMNGEYITDTESYAYAIYGDFAKLSSAPKTVFEGAGYVECSFNASDSVTEAGSLDISRVYTSFLKSPANSAPYGKNGVGEKKSYDLAAVTTRAVFDNETTERTFSYVFCANDGDFFSNELLGEASYANFEIMSALITNMSRVDIYASTDLGGTSLNTKNFGGKQLVSTILSEDDVEIYSSDAKLIGINRGIEAVDKTIYTVLVAIVPLFTLVFAFIIFFKRKFM